MSGISGFLGYGPAQIVAAYLIILIVPGPIMIAIGCLASLHGFRAALPFIIGISLGTVSLAVSVALFTTHAAAWVPAYMLYFLATAALLWTAVRLLRSAAPGDLAECSEGSPRALLSAGMVISISDPLTIAFMSAAFVGPYAGHGTDGTSILVFALLFGIPEILWHVTAALGLSRPSIRRVAVRAHAALKATAAGILSLAAVSCAARGLGWA
ncbi:threonine/homoserine/homoserine lactone efflux protein [Rhodoligotrophos appendicifer]|uniref:LysE family translocator n=1 Tax=Rhodoligotrophos appendicifer TaxID=987056 RepID=UPI001478C0D7|nr:LysE family transporter [Rhodoligotrophos appendicifer]